MSDYIFATDKIWHIEEFLAFRDGLVGNWTLATGNDDLIKLAEAVGPRYIFFPHWSYILPKAFCEKYNCVCFHMTDVPYGRGGSPLQNLISRGAERTKISALKMIEVPDAGPVYMKRDLLLTGSAHEIFRSSAKVICEMIKAIIEEEPVPIEQQGEAVVFKRRRPSQSVLSVAANLKEFYDQVRMLDAPGYPSAFLETDLLRLEFTNAQKNEGSVVARVKVISKYE
jgi:methionyl-tRNA formyltransferase